MAQGVQIVRENRQVLRRLARRQRQAAAKSIQNQESRPHIRKRNERTRPPKKQGEGPTITAILLAKYSGRAKHTTAYQAAKLLISIAGSLAPKQLSAAHIMEAGHILEHSGYTQTTKATKSASLRRILLFLWEHHAAPKLDGTVPRFPGIRPRNVTATDAEITRLLAAANPPMRLLILLCSDLAIRSGTAANIGPQHYDPITQTLRFQSKYTSHLTMPATSEIAAILETCDHTDPTPYCRQLQAKQWLRGRHVQGPTPHPSGFLNQFGALRRSVGITRKLTLHDLRRTTAVKLYEHTSDARDVQALLGHRSLNATIWYLDHDLRPVLRNNLELIKRRA